MSRKREAKRERDKELAAQLGVKKDEVPEQLLSHARVTEPHFAAHVDVVASQRRWLRWPMAIIDVGMWVVDASGAQALARGQLQLLAQPATANTVVPCTIVERVRYTRPAHVLVHAFVAETSLREIQDGVVPQLATDTWRDHAGPVGLSHKRLTHATTPVALQAEPFVGACTAFAAVHRIDTRTTFQLRIERCTVDIHVELRT